MQFAPTLLAVFGRHKLTRAIRRLSFLGGFLLSGILPAIAGEIWESRGTMTVERFGHHGEVETSIQHEYSLASSEQGFRIRAMTSWDEYEQGMLVVSDWKSLYQANRITKTNTGRKPTVYSLAKFEFQQMPTFETYGWGPMQALALANYLLRIPGKVLNGNELRSEYVPELIATRGRELRKPQIRTQCFSQDGAPVTRIVFWGVVEGAKSVSLAADSPDCILLGELRIDGFEKALPTKMYFVINGLHVESPDPKQPRTPAPLAAVTFVGKIGPGDPGALNEISYDAGVQSAVRDYRFPQVKVLSYTLKESDPLPFDADPAGKGANVAQQTYGTLVEHRDVAGRKRQIVLGTFSFSVLALIAAFFVRSNRINSKSTVSS